MNAPSDLHLLEDPLAIFLRTTGLITEQQAALDKTAAIRARAVVALYARGYTYKQLADLLDLSAPRIGQLVGSTDESTVEVIRAWTEVERLLAHVAGSGKDDARMPYRSAVSVLARSDKFGHQALTTLEELHRLRNELAHARRDVTPQEAELFVDSARYLSALLQVFLTEGGKQRKYFDDCGKVMQRIRFEQLSPREYEDMVTVLLSRERQTRRVDGAGGDGGVDCYFSDKEGTDAYELKSFTGRMTPSRRNQIKSSLARAMRQSPRSWTVVVPIDPTPAEQRWFDSLQAGVPSRLEWKGKTWLEEKLAAYPDIARYFAGAADEVVRLLADVARVDALPNDARVLRERIGSAVRRLNETDPYYQFSFSVAADAATITAHPRYPDAARDQPLRVSATLRFDDSSQSMEVQKALEEFMTFGTQVVIPAANVEGLVVDAPGGLGGDFPHAELVIDGTFQPPPEAAATIVLRVPPLPPVHHSLKLRIDKSSRGPEGGLRLIARDSSGLLTLDLRVDPARHSHQSHLTYRYIANIFPQDAVPVLRICAALARGEQMAFTDPGGNVLGIASGRFDPDDWPELYMRCAEKLDEIQQLAGAAFPLPLAFTPDDQRDMEYARMLLSGESIHATWSGMSSHAHADTVRNLLSQIDSHGQPFAFASIQEETLEVAGGRLPLGWVQRYIPSARVSNLEDVRNWHQAGGHGSREIRLEPTDSGDMVIRHLPDGPPSPRSASGSGDQPPD